MSIAANRVKEETQQHETSAAETPEKDKVQNQSLSATATDNEPKALLEVELTEPIPDEPIDYSELSDPFADDWDELSEESKQKYYDEFYKYEYEQWCRDNPPPKKQRRHLIETILPAYQTHVMCGESGAGKTSITLTLLNDWLQGKEVLGHRSNPVPMMYLAYDRGKAATEETFDNLGLDHRVFGYHEITKAERDLDLVELLRKLKVENPSVELFVIDGMFMIAPDVITIYKNNRKVEIRDPYKVMASWLTQLDELCNELGITIIGTTHAAKNNAAEHAGRRTKVLGTVATPATTGTTFIADLESETRTKLTVRPRCAAMETWYFDRQPDGKMQLVNVEEENHDKFRWFLSTTSEPFSSSDLQDETGLFKSTAGRYLVQAEREGLVSRTGKGKNTKWQKVVRP